MVGVRTAPSLPQAEKKSEPNMSLNDCSLISLISAPAAKAFSLPVMMIAPVP
ncbi:Uncharacterised protein [Mycobacteroides abscessus subsp. abscessus]|nr:Uncharacterised protein [Mycobacteroides abscessus subsp. abscessus]